MEQPEHRNNKQQQRTPAPSKPIIIIIMNSTFRHPVLDNKTWHSNTIIAYRPSQLLIKTIRQCDQPFSSRLQLQCNSTLAIDIVIVIVQAPSAYHSTLVPGWVDCCVNLCVAFLILTHSLSNGRSTTMKVIILLWCNWSLLAESSKMGHQTAWFWFV